MQKLETYRVPREMVKQGYPARIGTLFRDDDEIPASSNLSMQIEEALDNSEFLIVVCSKSTPESKWVRREIAIFKELGRADKILALLIEGEPSEAFPPELRFIKNTQTEKNSFSAKSIFEEIEPIASDVRPQKDEKSKETKKRAFLRIAAALLGCRLDDLVQRHKTREKRHQRTLITVFTVLFLVICGGSFYWWDHTRVKTTYYSNYGIKWGVPFGINSIKTKTQVKRTVSYALNSKGGKIISMRKINGVGALTQVNGTGTITDLKIDYGDLANQKITQWDFQYRSDGTLSQVISSNSTGKVIKLTNYKFFNNNKTAVINTTNKTGKPITQIQGTMSLSKSLFDKLDSNKVVKRSISTQQEWVFTHNGLVKEKRNQTIWRTPVSDESGVYAYVIKYSPLGQIKSTITTNKFGEWVANKVGVAEIRMHYSSDGDLEKKVGILYLEN